MNDFEKKQRTLMVMEGMYHALMYVMWIVGGITVVGDFITWSLWNDFELSGPIDIRMTTAWAGCGWMAVCGVGAIVAFIGSKIMIPKVDAAGATVNDDEVDWDRMMRPVKAEKICWIVGIGVSLLILIVGNILCLRAVPVSAEGREAILALVQEDMPDKELSVEESAGHRYTLEIKGTGEHSYESLSVEYRKTQDLLDSENFALYLDFDTRYFDLEQMLGTMEAYLTSIDEDAFYSSDISYALSEAERLKEQMILRMEDPGTLEKYEERVDLQRGEGEISLYLQVDESIIELFDGSSYQKISVSIHGIGR